MNFFLGLVSGAAAALGAAAGMKHALTDRHQLPMISEFHVRSFWMEAAGLYDRPANPPFTQNNAKADVAIVGGGLTGLAAAYHLKKRFPEKRIVLLEAARCGYGASGRNGGILQDFDNSLLMELYHKKGSEAARRYFEIDRQGPILVRSLIQEHQMECDLEECGLIETATDESQMEKLAAFHEYWADLGIESRMVGKEEIQQGLNTTFYCGGLHKTYAGMLNPAKYALGLKSVLENQGVEVYECTKVASIDAGSMIRIETEFGDLTTEAVVLATNAYSHKIGYFKKRLFPLGTYIIATAPLSDSEMESVGWKGREVMWDMRPDEYNYLRITPDNRIVIGGGLTPYFYGNGLSSGNYKPSLTRLESDLVKIWPQLRGVEITHKWGGTLGMTMDFHPTMGVMGDHKNVYYGVGYSGHGVSWTQLAGKIIGQLYAGEDTELTRFYCVNKTPPYIPPEPFRKIGFHLYKRFLVK